MFKHILLATDGSPASEHAAQLAVNMARAHGAKLTAVFVVDPYPYMGVGEINPQGFQSYMSAAQNQAAKAHAQVEAMNQKDGPAVVLETRLVEDTTAASGIVHTVIAIDADLVVLGSHGRGGIARMMLGSVSTKVVAESSVPVLVTR